MKQEDIKAGCDYRTRNGKRAHIYAVNVPDASEDERIHGTVDGGAWGWTLEGRFMMNSCENNYDLVAPWGETTKEQSK